MIHYMSKMLNFISFRKAGRKEVDSMETKKVLEAYYKRLRRESVLKAFISGGSIALFCMFVAAFVTWFMPIKGVWVALGVFAGALALAVPLFYFKKYRPQLKTVAKRLDGLGLDEKILTMTELEGDDSIMAVYQRNSAMEALRMIKSTTLKFAVSGLSIAALIVSFVFGTTMTTVNALSSNGTLPSGNAIIPTPEQENYCIVKYEIIYVDQYGYILENEFGCEFVGNDEQVVPKGGDAEPIDISVESEPLPDKDQEYTWAFYGWYGILNIEETPNGLLGDFKNDPISTSPYRQDLNVTPENCLKKGAEITIDEDGYEVINYRAICIKLPVDESENGGDGDPSEGGDPSDAPPEEGDEPGDPSEDPGDGSGGGDRDNKGSTAVDGDQYYGDRMAEYLEMYRSYIASGAEVPSYLQAIIDAYYGSLS